MTIRFLTLLAVLPLTWAFLSSPQSSTKTSVGVSLARKTLTTTFASKNDNILYLQSLGAITSRGEFANEAQKASAVAIITELEEKASSFNTTEMITGTWELVFTNTHLFRSSPFFMAGRAVCKEGQQADQFNWFCDMHRKALAISTIKSVRQIISPSKLVSEFEVTAGAIPFLNDFTPFSYSGGLPLTIDGSIVSTADFDIESNDLVLHMDTVEIKGSNLPGVRQVLDNGLKLESRGLAKFLQDNLSGYKTPKPIFRTTYLDDKFRISRDQDNHVFVYVKTSESTTPTDYSKIDSDLGVIKLLEGFNDAVTRFYL